MRDIAIFTRFYKTDNLPAIRENLKTVLGENGVSYYHFLIPDLTKATEDTIADCATFLDNKGTVGLYYGYKKSFTDPFNIRGINGAFWRYRYIEDLFEYCYVLDDDNLLKDNFHEGLRKAQEIESKLFIINLERKSSQKWSCLRNLTEYSRGIDFASFLVRWDVVNDMHYVESKEGDTDSVNLWMANGIKPDYYGKVCGYYNKLNPDY